MCTLETTLTQAVQTFVEHEMDVKTKIKNFLISFIQENRIRHNDLIEGGRYHVWSSYTGGTLKFKGETVLLKIELDDFFEDTVRDEHDVLSHCLFTDVRMQRLFKTTPYLKPYHEIIDFLYSGKCFETFSHLSWDYVVNNPLYSYYELLCMETSKN